MDKLNRLKQLKDHRKQIKQDFKNSIDDVKKHLLRISLPLTIIDNSHLYRWLFREQISLKDIPKPILHEFMKTKQYAQFRSNYKFHASRKQNTL